MSESLPITRAVIGNVPQCCIHIIENVGENVKLFTQETLDKSRHVLAARKKNSMLYREVKLPSVPNLIDGYHTHCYRKFTAIKNDKLKDISKADIQTIITSESPNLSPTTAQNLNTKSEVNVTRSLRKGLLRNPNTGIFQNICIFCNKRYIYVKKKRIDLTTCATKSFEVKIKQYASILKDQQMLEKITDIDFIAKEVHYHAPCRVKYQKRYNKFFSKNKKDCTWHLNRKYHTEALNEVKEFVVVNVIKKCDSFYLKDIYNLYKQVYLEISNDHSLNLSFTSGYLKTRLDKIFKGNVLFSRYKREIIVYPKNMQFINAVKICTSNNRTVERDIGAIAFKLRRDILNVKRNNLPPNPTIKHIIQGECEIPPLVKLFFVNLLSGPRCGGCHLEKRKETKIDSLCHDVIYCTTNGRIKPSKQMELGLVMKSLTGSRKVLNILNRLGHTASYSVIEELETELTYSSIETNSFIPDDVVCLPSLGTAVAFDNYDRFVETLSGKNTLHDTVGVLYQNKTEVQDKNSSNVEVETINRKRRRMFNQLDLEIEPYFKKPRLQQTLSIAIENISSNKPANLKFVRNLDNLWMVSLALLETNSIPFWTGWNNSKIHDTLPQQKIWYLPPINASPTSLSVVVDTLKKAKKISVECNQQYISVTYDLAIAKLAYQIQHAESPSYDNLFIQLGSFHIEMSFFKALGKYIEESGGPAILTECEILASGSLKGFISGTHYNRCKRIHLQFATALQILHFKEFLSAKELPLDDIIKDLQILQKTNSLENVSLPNNLQELLEEYEKYYQQTENGSHGATAKYWITYISFVKLYLEFSRSIRTGDFDLYVYSLPQIASLMFSMNHQNYSRWILKYYNNLINVDTTHPGFKETLLNGGFSIRRTDKSFSRTAIDLTLEQTINADAANKLTGISNFTNSIHARTKWAVSHSLRTSLITHMLEKLNLTKTDDVTNCLRPHIIKKNNSALTELLHQIQNNINPFGIIKKEELFNLSTGKSVSQKTKDFLLNIVPNGEKLRDKFIKDCLENPLRFEERIPKQDISTFASENKSLVRKSNGKIEEVKTERDLFGRILVLSIENKLDIKNILSFPLTPVPLSMCHIDGSINKTVKSNLLKILEKRAENILPNYTDSIVIDGFYLLHLIGETPVTFGKFAQFLLSKLCKYGAHRIDLIFDKFITPSIKDVERDRRANLLDRTNDYIISGPEQRTPSDFIKSLRNDNFKISVVKFICENWQNDCYAPILSNKCLYVNCDDICYKFYSIDGLVHREIDDNLFCAHEEADSRIVYHLSKMPSNSQVIIKTSDTDVLIIILGNIHNLPENLSMWLEVGVQSKNTLRLINVNTIARSLGVDLCKALPGFHSFTGCDYTSAFSRKGKIRPFNLLEQDTNAQKAFGSLGFDAILTDEQVTIIERFLCKIYSRKHISDINEVRFDIFMNCYKPKKNGKPLEGLKKFDGSMLPPCKDVFVCKLKRTNQICSMWNNSTLIEPPFYSPLEHGWVLIGGKLQPQWSEGPQTPTSVDEMCLKDPQSNLEENEDEIYLSSSDED